MADKTALARAKINLVLEVGGRRPDGYHEIDTVLQEIALADRITLARGPATGVAVSGPRRAGVPADEENIVWRAAEALAGRVGHRLTNISFHLDKQIPAAAGLGGGSSDAAAALRLLAGEWGAPDAAVRAAAAAVGSDSPFFLVGGRARARGRGERVTPLPPLPPHDVVIFLPAETLERKTERLFAALDSLPFDRGRRAVPAFLTRTPGRLSARILSNSFERVAYDVFPGLAQLRADLEAALGEPLRLSGAGPALFWIGPPGGAAAIIERAREPACAVIATETAR